MAPVKKQMLPSEERCRKQVSHDRDPVFILSLRTLVLKEENVMTDD